MFALDILGIESFSYRRLVILYNLYMYNSLDMSSERAGFLATVLVTVLQEQQYPDLNFKSDI